MNENPHVYAVGEIECRQPTGDAMAFVRELLEGIENSFAEAIEADNGWSEAGSLAAIGDSIDMLDQLLKTYDGQRIAFSDHLAEWAGNRGMAALEKAAEARNTIQAGVSGGSTMRKQKMNDEESIRARDEQIDIDIERIRRDIAETAKRQGFAELGFTIEWPDELSSEPPVVNFSGSLFG